MLDDDAVHHIRHVVETIHHLLEMIVDFIADEEGHGIGFGFGLVAGLLVMFTGVRAILPVLFLKRKDKQK